MNNLQEKIEIIRAMEKGLTIQYSETDGEEDDWEDLKTNKPRVVYIPKEILAEFNNFKGFTMSYQRLGRAFQNLCNALDLPYAGFHSLRHTYASLLLNDKVNPLIIKEALGHSSMKMLEQVYGHFTGVKTEDKETIKASLDTIRAHQD